MPSSRARITGDQNQAAEPLQPDHAPSAAQSTVSGAMRGNLRLVLPLPPKEYCLNSRTHWAIKHKVNRQAQDMVMAALLATRQSGLTFTRPRAAAKFVFPARTVRDHDNFVPRLKPYWDALVHAGVLPDDNIDTLGWPQYSHEYARPGCVIITIEE